MRKQKYLKSGEAYAATGKYREAEIQFQNAIAVDPNYTDAHYQLAEAFIKLRQPDRAEQELARAVELDPGNYQARLEHANLLILNQSFQQAQSEIDVLLRQHPNDPAVRSVVSSLFAGEGDLPGAIKEMEMAVSLAPDRWETRLSLALLQLKNNQPDAAEASLRKVIELDPASAQPYFTLGSYYQSRGRFRDAEQQFELAITVDHISPAFRAALARVYLAEGKEKEAEELLRQAKVDFPDNSAGYRLLGDFYFVTGDLDKALAEYGSLRQQHPQDLALKKNYIELLIQKGRFAEAQPLIAEILKRNANDSDALVYRSQIEISNGQADGTIATLQTVIENDPTNAAAHYVLGVAFDKSGNLEQAISEWKQALQLQPDFLDAQRALGIAAMRKGDNEALEQAATQLIALRPGSPEGYGLRALSNTNRKRFVEAEKDARQTIAVAPQDAFGYVQMGNLSFAQQQYGEAAAYFRKALDYNPNSIDALRGIVNSYLARKQSAEAITAINLQIGKSPQSSQFYDLLGTVLFREKKDLTGAQNAFSKSIQLDANNLQALSNLAQIDVLNGQIDQGIALYESALKANSHDAGLYVSLGHLYESKQDWKKAEDSYQNALVIRPNDPVASNSLASVMVNESGNFDQALILAQSAQRSLPDSPAVADTLGWIYYHKGAYATAIGLLQQSVKLQEKARLPDNPGVHYHLGLAYSKADQRKQARLEFDRVLKLDPNYSAAEDVKKELARLGS